MIIIIEGIDRVGKTTLKKRLEGYGFKGLNSLIQHTDLDAKTTQLIHNERIFAATDILKLIDKTTDIVIDRFHWSQYVYGAVDRELYDYSMLRIDSELADLNAILVLVDPVDIRWSSEQHGAPLTRHQELFNRLYDKSTMRKVRIKYTDFEKIFEILSGGFTNGN